MAGKIPLEYASPDLKRHPWYPDPIWVWLLLACVLVVLWALVPTGHGNHRLASIVYCGSNLRQIGIGIQLYAKDYAQSGSPYPPDLQAILLTQSITPESFICLKSSDTRAIGTTPAIIATNMRQPGKCSYIYVGAGLTAGCKPECVLALEDPGNHGLEGGNVLFGDGHVEMVEMPMLMQYYNDLATGLNPPATKTTFTGSTARKDYRTNWRARMPQMKSGVWVIPTTRPMP